MDANFKIWYDDNPHDIVETISKFLEKIGFEICIIDAGDGWVQYKIVEKVKE